jgi:uncharacterized protein (TIGR02099 family)
MLKKLIKRLYQFILYSFAFAVLTSAIVITVVRLALPGIGSYRQQTQDWLSEYMNYPVAISNIDANWNSWNPNLQLHQVSILDPASNEQILDINSVLININFVKSLIRNEITPEAITISDLDLTLIRRDDGSITVSKELPTDIKDEQMSNDVLAKWFLAQKNILVKKAQIRLLGVTQNDDPLLLSNASLWIKNNDYRTQIKGTAILPESYGHMISFVLDAHGNVLTPDWAGELYLQGENINISPLLANIETLDVEKHEGTGDIKLWSTWSNAKLRQLEGQVNLKEIKLENNHSETYINNLTGNFSVTRRIDKGIELTLDIEKLVTPNGMWPETAISIKKIYDKEHYKYRYIANASYLKLDDIDTFLNVFSNLSDKFLQVNDIELTGSLRNSLIKYDPTLEPSERFYIESEFSHLGTQSNDNSFKIEGLSGHLHGTQGQGNLHITSNVAGLELDSFLAHPLTFYELNTELNWQFKNNNLLLSTPLLDTHTQDFNLQVKGDLIFNHDRKLPFVDLLLELSNVEIDKVTDYLPINTPENLTRWLSNSLVSGKIPSANFIFRGWMEDYPFKNNEGVFQGHAEVSEASLDYHPEWPGIDQLNAELIVNSDTLTIEANSGNIYDAEITKTSAVIENLSRRDLKKSAIINGHINGKLKDAMLFIKNSPLQKSASLKDLPSQNISGDMDLDLTLDVPLPSGLTLVNGSIALHDALLDSEDIGIELADLNGTINFTQDSVSAVGINAHYFNHPVHLTIESKHGSPLKSTLSGSADNQFISAQLLRYFPYLESMQAEIERRITGTCLWQASRTNPDSSSDVTSAKKLHITSSLEGLSIDLPAPLAKSTASMPLELLIKFPEKNKQEINIQYANILDGIIDISDINGEKSITTALVFGGKVFGDRALSDKAIHDRKNNQLSITGNIDHLIVGEWFDLITSNSNKNESADNSKPVTMDLKIGSLEFINQTFSEVNLKLNNKNSGYHLNINAEDISGDIRIESLGHNTPVDVNLQKLNLVKNESTDNNKNNEITPDVIPPLNLVISDLHYDNIDLGEMSLSTSKIDNGLSVDNINFNKSDMTINGAGLWETINNKQHSKFNFTLNAASMKTMLETFNYDVATIEKGKINLTLDAEWQGAPVEFSLSNITGNLHMNIEKGRFTDIDPSAGRLFGLLSLQTLPRRLSLDFSDLFGKGLVFDLIAGHFDIDNGNAYTNNLAMRGPSVSIDVSGRTGLVDQDYDQIATITPKISDSLPVASALFGPIGVGVGAVIYVAGEIFHSLPSKIDTILRKQYTITGAWDDPQVTKIKRQKEDKDNNG